jgi:NADH:ubiquinone oxidoreductase subunit 5 (subunit L)/multisubunit Na+/H+ antiporter MnhA subunit
MIGVLIHTFYSQQDSRKYRISRRISIFVQIQFCLTLFCLSGLLFRRGFSRKDIILENFVGNMENLFLTLVYVILIFLTFLYSIRLFFVFFKINSSRVFLLYKRINIKLTTILLFLRVSGV